MKIGKGQGTSLIEQMHKAQAEQLDRSKGTNKTSRAFSMQGATEASQAAPQHSVLQTRVIGVAQRVIDGKVQDVDAARKEVLNAIVDTRYGDLLPAAQKRQSLKMLEQVLLDDPQFVKEVDQMLVFAASHIPTP